MSNCYSKLPHPAITSVFHKQNGIKSLELEISFKLLRICTEAICILLSEAFTCSEYRYFETIFFFTVSSKIVKVEQHVDRSSLEETAEEIAKEIDNGTYDSDWDSSDEEDDGNDEKSNSVTGSLKKNTNGTLFHDGNHSKEGEQESNKPISPDCPMQRKSSSKPLDKSTLNNQEILERDCRAILVVSDVKKSGVKKLTSLPSEKQQSSLSDFPPLGIPSNNNILTPIAENDYGNDFESDEEGSVSFNDDIDDLLTGLDEIENKRSKGCTSSWVK